MPSSFAAAYGTSREDTLPICGDADNGFGLLVNWNGFGDGPHEVRALADGEEFGRLEQAAVDFNLDLVGLTQPARNHANPTLERVGLGIL